MGKGALAVNPGGNWHANPARADWPKQIGPSRSNPADWPEQIGPEGPSKWAPIALILPFAELG